MIAHAERVSDFRSDVVRSRHSRAAEVFRRTVSPLVLVLVTPVAVILLWVACTYLDGLIFALFTARGVSVVLRRFPRPSWAAAEIIVGFAAFELLLLKVLPGRIHEGPTTPTGNRPEYKVSAVPAWLLTHATFLGASYGLGWFAPDIVYLHLGYPRHALHRLLLPVLGLYVKGVYAPSTSDAGTSGNAAFDDFWGVELHRSVLGVNLKQFINCRVSMMGWSLMVISFAAHQRQVLGHASSSMLVTVVLQVAYLFEFFTWEDGYFATLDVMHDRFGYYICWGVLAWVPGSTPCPRSTQ